MIHHRISKKREKLIYKCSQCGTENLEIKIKYKLVWNNKKKGESLDIKEGYFILIPPHKIYQEIKDYEQIIKEKEEQWRDYLNYCDTDLKLKFMIHNSF